MDDFDIVEKEEGILIESDKDLPNVYLVEEDKEIEVLDDSFYIPDSEFDGNIILTTSMNHHVGFYGDDTYEKPLKIILPEAFLNDNLRVEIIPRGEDDESETFDLNSDRIQVTDGVLHINNLIKGLLYDVVITSESHESRIKSINQLDNDTIDYKSFIEEEIEVFVPEYVQSGNICFSRGFDFIEREFTGGENFYSLHDYFIDSKSVDFELICGSEDKFESTVVTLMPDNYEPAQKIVGEESRSICFSDLRELCTVELEIPDFIEAVYEDFYRNLSVNSKNMKINKSAELPESFNKRYNVLDDEVIKKIIPEEINSHIEVWNSGLPLRVDTNSESLEPGGRVKADVSIGVSPYPKISYYINSGRDSDSVLVEIRSDSLFKDKIYKLKTNQIDYINLELEDESVYINSSEPSVTLTFVNIVTGEKKSFSLDGADFIFEPPIYLNI